MVALVHVGKGNDSSVERPEDRPMMCFDHSKYTIADAPTFREMADSWSYSMIEGHCVGSRKKMAMAIDLIFTSKAPWWRECHQSVDVD